MRKSEINSMRIFIKLLCRELELKQATIDKAYKIYDKLRKSGTFDSYKGSILATSGVIVHVASILANERVSQMEIAEVLEIDHRRISEKLDFIRKGMKMKAAL